MLIVYVVQIFGTLQPVTVLTKIRLANAYYL